MKKIFIFLFFIFMSLSSITSFAQNLGSFGKTYPIQEKDALEEIYEQASKINIQEKYKLARQKAIRSYTPKNIVNLPEAKKNNTFTSELIYTLNYNIPNQYGGILYPKGYTFNVLNYINIPEQIIIFDIKNKKQLNWIKKNKFLEKMNTIFIATNGEAKDLINFITTNYRKVFFCTQDVVDVFKIKSVPSIVTQNKNKFQIQEIVLKEES